MELSRRALDVQGSVTLAIDSKAKELKSQGADVVGFGAGEPDFDTPSYIIEAAKQALDTGKTRYTPVPGIPELRKAICDKLEKDNGLTYDISQIVVSNGAKHSLYNAFYAILDTGDEVILPGPCWVSYPEIVKMVGGVPVIVDADEQNGFKVTAAQIEAAITPKTKALLLNSPNNPNGCVYTKSELAAIAEVCVRRDLFVVSDEIYELLIYDGEHVSIASLGEEIKKRTIVINGVSKAYAMTGWRIGYTASDAAIAKVMTNFQSHATSNSNSIAQYASVAALTKDSGQAQAMKEEFARRRLELHRLLNQVEGLSCLLPQGAFYIMLNIKDVIGRSYQGQVISGSMDFAQLLLMHKLVAVVPGIGFGADGYVRLSYAISMENIQKGVARIAEFVAELTDAQDKTA